MLLGRCRGAGDASSWPMSPASRQGAAELDVGFQASSGAAQGKERWSSDGAAQGKERRSSTSGSRLPAARLKARRGGVPTARLTARSGEARAPPPHDGRQEWVEPQ